MRLSVEADAAGLSNSTVGSIGEFNRKRNVRDKNTTVHAEIETLFLMIQ
jgi:hypothetical protein